MAGEEEFRSPAPGALLLEFGFEIGDTLSEKGQASVLAIDDRRGLAPITIKRGVEVPDGDEFGITDHGLLLG